MRTHVSLMVSGILLFSGIRLGHSQPAYSFQAPRGNVSKAVEGSEIPTAEAASRFAFKAYMEKMKLAISDDEAPGGAELIELGFAVPEFVDVGEQVWEVRITSKGTNGTRAIRSIMWVNPRSERIVFLVGPWPPAKAEQPRERVVNSAETNNQMETGKATVKTNQVNKMKGFMRQTRVLTQPDEATRAKLNAIIPRLRVSREQAPNKTAPQNIEEASDYLTQNMAMARPPGACLEIGGTFFFSGGHSDTIETNFMSGFAIRKNDTTIFSWDEGDSKFAKP